MGYSVSEVEGDVDDSLKRSVKNACEEVCRRFQSSDLRNNGVREQAMKNSVDHLQAAFPQYNIMVVYTSHQRHFNQCAHCSLTIDVPAGVHNKIEVYVFKNGSFTLTGHGGFINWCFSGNFNRNGNHVTFNNP